jgi:8-oxo-dGTP pyrophosphatase MutT (NUDIX family)
MSVEKKKPGIPVPAATVLLIRDGDDGIEVFMVERNSSMHFASALVFPGGLVDPEDTDDALIARCDGVAGLSKDEAALRIAGVRETFEECGVVLARHTSGDTVLEGDEAAAFYDKYHVALNAGDVGWGEIIAKEDLILCCDRMAYFAHWITPEGRPKRFDTHFFLARMPRRQHAAHDGNESVQSVWLRPPSAVEAGEKGERIVMFPTRLNLELLEVNATVEAAMEVTAGREIVTVLPKWTATGIVL